jgi:hypothetical protein
MVGAASFCAGGEAGHSSVTQAQVAAAISDSGTPVTADQVTLLTNVTATTNAPSLKVDSVQGWGDRQLRIRMSCASPQECLPFYVAVGVGEDASRSLAAFNRSPAATSTASTVVVRNGSPATLLINQGRVHIQLRVVCLESGSVGQTIRVEDKINKMIYLAQIVDKSQLRGGL